MEYQGSPEHREFSYGEIVRSALRISWRNKFLWFFGLFVGGGLSSNFNIPSNFGGTPQNQDVPNFDQLFSTAYQGGLAATGGLATSGPVNAIALQSGVNGGTVALIIGGVVVALVVGLLVLALIFISQGGLASSVAAIDSGEERRFGSTWRAGLSNLWRVLLQAILFFLIGLGIFIAVSLVAGLPVLLTFLLSESVGLRVAMSIIFGFVAVLLLIALFIPLTIITQLALRDLVVGGNGITASIGESYRLFRRNLGRSLLVWLINIGLKIAVGILTLLVLGLIGLVLVGPGIAVGFSGATTTGIVLAIVGGVLFLIPAILVSAAVGTYFHSYWTLAYLRMNGIGGAPVAAAYPTPYSPQSGYTSQQYGDPGGQTATAERPGGETQEDEASGPADSGSQNPGRSNNS